MKHGTSNRRSRNRGNGSRKNNKTQVFDSNGPDVRIRGTAYQVCEKYLALAKDAAATGDKIMAENFLQHAEHYQRIINEWGDNDHRTVSSDRNEGQETQQDKEKTGNNKDDLSLPSSILGSEVKTDSQEGVRASQDGTLEDA